MVLCLSLVGCTRNPERTYNRLETSAAPYYRVYFEGPPRAQFEAMRKVERLMNRADPGVWRVTDRDTYAAWVYGRESLAAQRAGLKQQAAYYARKALRTFERDEAWDSSYQKMLPVTPSPRYDEAERELLGGINAVDEVIRKRGWQSRAGYNSPAATPRARPAASARTFAGASPP